MALTIALLLGSLGLLVWAFDDDSDEAKEADSSDTETQRGDDGDDDLVGTDGMDALFGEGGDDLLAGEGGDDRLFGSDGVDAGLGGSGDDLVRGGADDDLLIGGEGSDDLRGDTGDDVLFSAEIVDETALLAILDGSDTTTPIEDTVDLTGETNAAADTVNGGFGDDLLVLGAGDQATGGDGNDEYQLGSWIEPGDPATITDFNIDEDVIIYFFEGNTAPAISVVSDDDGTATVFADGEPFLIVPNAGDAFEDSTIQLEPLDI
ncbi:MAG: calcium-binding protein [Pseudomonadota bacterium]